MNAAVRAVTKVARFNRNGRSLFIGSNLCLLLIGKMLLSLAGVSVHAQAPETGSSPALAWRSSDPIVPPDFDSYFPDDPAAAGRLAEAVAPNRSNIKPVDLVSMVRQGLRRAEQKTANQWITWLGQEIAGGRLGEQAPQATEVMYHASGRPEYQQNALYYGLMRVEKTPAILRRMVEIAMGSEDWINVIGHVAWATASEKEKTVAFLTPYEASNDPKIRAHAGVLKQIFSGETTAHDHWTRIQTQQATEQFGGRMGELRTRMAEGDSAARLELL